MIYFALLDDDSTDHIVDSIPLNEIIQVKKLGVDGATESHQGHLHRKHSSLHLVGNAELSEGFHRTLRIDTHPEGYNSGRTYYLQIGSESEFSRLAISLVDYVKDAMKRFEAKSGLERIQSYFRKLFRSPSFQLTTAFFILAVRHRPFILHSKIFTCYSSQFCPG